MNEIAEQPSGDSAPENQEGAGKPRHPRAAYLILGVLAVVFIYEAVVNKTIDKFLAGLLTVIALTAMGYGTDRILERWLGGGK